MFIINRCFKNIWLESQMIHVALFSFQRTPLSFEALCFKRLLYPIASSGACQEVFLSFFKFFRLLQSLANQGFWALAGAVSLSDLYYDTVYKMTCQQLFAKKRRIVKLSATPLRNRPHMVFCSQGTFWGAGSTHGISVGCNPLVYP